MSGGQNPCSLRAGWGGGRDGRKLLHYHCNDVTVGRDFLHMVLNMIWEPCKVVSKGFWRKATWHLSLTAFVAG